MARWRRMIGVAGCCSALSIAACGDTTEPTREQRTTATTQAKTDEPSSTLTFNQENVAELVAASDEDAIKGARVVKVVGQVFNVQRGADNVAVQMWTRPDDSDGQLIVVFQDNASEVDEDDYLQVTGTVYDIYEGETGFGAGLAVPRILATDYKIVDATALSPPLKKYSTPQTRDLGGVMITVRRVEIAEKETRIYVKYQNNSGEDFYGSPSLVADGDQVEESYEGDLKGPATSVSPGASTRGVLAFEPVDPQARLRLTYDGYDANFNEVRVSFEYGS